MRLREDIIGALNLFCVVPGILSEDDVRVGQALADVATMAILAQRSAAQAELLAAQLQHALNSRIIIEQAKGVLAERRRVSMNQAFDLIRGHARSNNLRLSDVARDIAENSDAAMGLLLRAFSPVTAKTQGADTV